MKRSTTIPDPDDMRDPGARTDRSSQLGVAALAVAALLWGGSFVLGKWVLMELPAVQALLLRLLIGCAALAPFVVQRRERITRSDLPLLAATGLVAVPVTYLLQYQGLARTTASSTALILGALPALLVMGSALAGEGSPRRHEWAAAAVSTLVVIVLIGAPGPGRTLEGDLLVFGSLLSTAVWIFLTKRLLRRHDAVVATAAPLLIGTLIFLPIALGVQGIPELRLSPQAWTSLAVLGLGCTAAASLLWCWGLRHVAVTRSGLYANLEPLGGALLGVWLLSEVLSSLAWLGGALILASALYGELRSAPAAAPASSGAGPHRSIGPSAFSAVPGDSYTR
jgi:drug/metabolite transporter (DMT)-like permease